MLAGQMTSLKSEVVQLGAQVQHRDQRMSEVEIQLSGITAGKCHGSGAASSANHIQNLQEDQVHHPPKHQRTVLVVKSDMREAARDIRTSSCCAPMLWRQAF